VANERKQVSPNPPPNDVNGLPSYLNNELRRLSSNITWDADVMQIREVSATNTFTLVLDDTLGGVVLGKNSITSHFVIDPTSAVAWPIGAKISLVQWGTGLCKISGSGAATIQVGNTPRFKGQYYTAEVVHVETDVWVASGGLV
jgi:hypothetical protein